MQNKKQITNVILLLSVLYSLLLVTCNLFNNLPETDLEKKMDEEIAWANAARLTVSVYFPAD